MKSIRNIAVWALLGGPVLLVSCDKEDQGSLEGPKPEGTFTTTSKTVGFTTEVTFTATTQNASFLSWEFGDGTSGTGQTVTHVYKTGGTLQPRLNLSGRGGFTSVTKELVVPSALNIVKQFLTGGSSKTWMLNNAVDAPIIVGTEAAPAAYFAGVKAGELPSCQSDDEYTFSSADVLTYNAKAQTYSANGFSCQASQSGTSPYVYGAAVGNGFAQLKLSRATAFIGTTDASPTEQVYRILEISEKNMVLRAGSGQSGGTVFTFKLVAK